MKITHLHIGGLLLAALFSAVATTGFSAEPTTVYNRKSGFLPGWAPIVWGDITADTSKVVSKEAGGVSLAIMPTAHAAPYAGLQIVAGGGGVVLTDAQRKGGEVHLYLRNGLDLTGAPAADQSVQVMLTFQPDGAKAFNGKYEPVVLEPALAIDKPTAGWQLVKLSIPKQVQDRADPSLPLKLRGVYVQYVDQPLAGYFVGEFLVVDPAAK